MIRRWKTWTVFAAGLIAVLTGMAWLSVTALALEKDRESAKREAAIEDRARLALWRMDSFLVPIMTRENARPYFTYNAFYPIERAYTRMFLPVAPGELMVPSPLLVGQFAYVRIHFQLSPDGALVSPEAPEGNMRDLAESRFTDWQKVAAAEKELNLLKRKLNYASLLSRIPIGDGETAMVTDAGGSSRSLRIGQAEQSRQEYNARHRNMENLKDQAGKKESRMEVGSDIREGLMTPLWLNGDLVLIRRVTIDGKVFLQGCLFDWSALRDDLLGRVRDLLPEADLVRPEEKSNLDESRILAFLPAALDAGQVHVNPDPPSLSVASFLVVVWAAALIGVAAATLLLHGAVSLSDKRADFVTAVTHELRTPLTTMKLYTEMLLDGMVPDEKKRHEYIATLSKEADRLEHLVENVLSYARLERGKSTGEMERVNVIELLESARNRLSEKVSRAGMAFSLEQCKGANKLTVNVNRLAFERIITNLIDNACKYASDAKIKTIHIIVELENGCVAIRVRDHGPGISADDEKRLFGPFHKSAWKAAGAAPGVGFGLSLCRRLAHRMGGMLSLDMKVKEGACFVLKLPIAAKDGCVRDEGDKK